MEFSNFFLLLIAIFSRGLELLDNGLLLPIPNTTNGTVVVDASLMLSLLDTVAALKAKVEITSCRDILFNNPNATSGVYAINRFSLYCDMETDGGGWTLIHKTDKSSALERYHHGYNEAALQSNATDDVAILPVWMIEQMRPEAYRMIATNDSNATKIMYFKGMLIPYNAQKDMTLQHDNYNAPNMYVSTTYGSGPDSWTNPGGYRFNMGLFCIGNDLLNSSLGYMCTGDTYNQGGFTSKEDFSAVEVCAGTGWAR